MPRATSTNHSGASVKFRKPGPATSIRATTARSSSRAVSPSAIAVAMSRGGRPASLATAMAIGLAMSPCSGLAGGTSATIGSATPDAIDASAAIALARSSRNVVVTKLHLSCLVGVGVASNEAQRPIELLDQHDAGQLVRHRQRSERQPLIARTEQALVDAAGPAYEERHGPPRRQAALQPRGKRRA